MPSDGFLRRAGVISVFVLFLTVFVGAASAQTPGERIQSSVGVQETTDEIMARQAVAPPPAARLRKPKKNPNRTNLPQHPEALAVSSSPLDRADLGPVGPKAHTTDIAFDGPIGPTETGAFPPDTMGAAGPTQFIAFENGRIRSYTKLGVADLVINADPDVFFASVMTPVSPPVVLNFTSDPNIRYDRFTARWYLSIIDVPCTAANCSTVAANRWMVAVSDAASNGVITGSTVWTFFQFQGDAVNFLDYPSLGIDVNALYIGGDMFTPAGAFVNTNAWVVQKTSSLGAGPIVVTAFANLLVANVGPFAPRGVDNLDPAAAEGYLVGVDNATFGNIIFRRISSPGSLTPTISANIAATGEGTTTFPDTVEHLGNTGGTNGELDALDDRLFAAMARGGRLWTAHNIRTTAAGVASTAAESRNSTRWYEFENLTTTPSVLQLGTVFDSAATRVAALQHFIPSVTVTGQGHAVLGFTVTGSSVRVNPGYVSRLAGDTLGTMVGPPAVLATTFGASSSAYNPPGDPGGAFGRRWGDYSFTFVDPLDDMTVWTIQEYCNATNTYAVRVARLLAPPPATPTCPIVVNSGTPTTNVIVTATSSAGSGFYDPGANLASPALPFSHISATVSTAVVNSTTFNSPTQITLNVTFTSLGLQDLVITNPDGQSVTANNCIDVQSFPVELLDFSVSGGRR